MFNYKPYIVQLAMNVPDSEKRMAEKAEESFEFVLSALKMALDHLDYIYIPFSKRQSMDSDEVVNNRVILRKYRDKIKDNFDKILEKAHFAMSIMSEFSSDAAVEVLMNAFISAIGDLEKQVNYLLSIFSNLNDPNFKEYLLSSIDLVKKEASQLRQIINDRVLEYIDTNILAKNWVSFIDDKYQEKIKPRIPLVTELYKERQKALTGYK